MMLRRTDVRMSVVEPPKTGSGSDIASDDLFASPPLPQHQQLVQGKLENGFTYVILPNANPAGRFETHLEVLSGSANELEQQQGMAHLLEHVAYMGSPKRQLISGTGSRTNAYTDFHHTVFFAACPVQTPDQFWKKPMMPMALDALVDVMTTTIDMDRLEKERAAVLSEASMVNKMEYRVECHILSSLHSENRISARFPIGKEELIKKWTREDLQLYHNTHYRPDNVILFVVGDVDVPQTIETIKEKFGSLQPKLDAPKLLRESGEFPDCSMRDVNRHFPPVIHRWSCTEEEAATLVPPALIKPDGVALAAAGSSDTSAELPTTAKVFQHELLQSFSFHLFAKRPIEPITSERALKRDLMRRMTLSALQIRLNVQQRQDPLFTFIDFNQLNWPREGCAVCSLDMTTDIGCWREAVIMAVREIRRLGLFGLTESELTRYKLATLSEAAQTAAQSDQMSNEDVLGELMEAEACGHTVMHPMARYATTEAMLESITLQEVNEIAQELCEHLSHMQPGRGVIPAAIVACTPELDREGQPFAISESEVASAVDEALAEELQPLEDTVVPDTLITAEQLEAKAAKTSPEFVQGLQGKAKLEGKNQMGVVQRQLGNGMKVNLMSLNTEPQRVSVRLYIPGGRMLEDRRKPGSVLMGARTMQEGGAFLSMTREEVELFCIDHLVMVDILATEEALILDFQTVTTPGPGDVVTGVEATLQVAHIILTDFKFEDDAFERARQSYHEQFDSTVKGLESACVESITYSLTGGDSRFLCPNHKQIDALKLDSSRQAVVSQLDPTRIEVSMSGDMTIAEMEKLVLTYMGTVPSRTEADKQKQQIEEEGSKVSKDVNAEVNRVKVRTLGGKQQLGVYLPDSDERAMGYLAGPAPNRWGFFSDGRSISQVLADANGNTNKKDANRRAHPLFGHAALLILQEVANRRLFSVVREERQLTYDASFQLQGQEILLGGWYLVSVTSSPAQVQAAVRACKEALTSLRGPFGVMGDSVQSAKRTLLNKFRAESATNKFWVEHLSGTQIEDIPNKTLSSIYEFEEVLKSVTVQDVQQLVEVLRLQEDNMTACVGITAATAPAGMQAPPKQAQQAQQQQAQKEEVVVGRGSISTQQH